MFHIGDVGLSAEVPLDSFLRRVSRITEKRFDEMGELDPSWALVTAGGKLHSVVTQFLETIEDPYGDKTKKASIEFICDYCKEHNVVRYAFVAEAWRGAKYASARPRVSPNRTEIVRLMVGDRGGAITATRHIVRPANDKPYLGKLELEDETPPPAKYGVNDCTLQTTHDIAGFPTFAPDRKTPRYSWYGDFLYQTRQSSLSEVRDDEGSTVFVTNVPDAPFQIVERRGRAGELFVGRLIMPRDDVTKVSPEELAASKVKVVTGQEAQKLISHVLRRVPKN